jgi:hypothetical protein
MKKSRFTDEQMVAILSEADETTVDYLQILATGDGFYAREFLPEPSSC